MQSKLIHAAAVAALLLFVPAAAAAGDAKTAHEAKPATHEKDAAEKGAGDHAQQNRMKACNAEAGKKNLKGDERRAFMSSCLKG